MATIATITNKKKGIKVIKMTYDFAAHTGAVGDYLSAEYIPKGAVILRAIYVKQTALEGAGSSVAVAVGTTVIKAATAFDNGAYTAVATELAAIGATANPVAAHSQVKISISGAVLTAGKFDLYVEYI